MPQSESAARPGSPGWALAVIATGVLITAVDTTIVVLALPHIQRSLHASLSSVVWIIVSYLLVITLLSTQVGRLGDIFGRVRMYEAGFGVFVLGSLCCALAWNEPSMIGFRVLQGVGGAFIAANSGAVIADTFPPERRGRAYGFNAVGWNIGAIIGIVLGGLITTYLSWRWVFWINVPIGLAALAVALRVLRERGERQPRTLDLWGMGLLGMGLFGILWAMIKLSSSSFDGPIAGGLVAGVVFLVAFALVEKRVREPMIALRLFRIPTMSPSLLAAFFQGLANFAVLFLLIMYLQGVRHLTPLDGSLWLVPGYLIGGVASPFGGRLADRLGPAWPATVGLLICVGALLIYTQLTTTSPLWLVSIGSVVNGVGSGAFFPANTAAVMRAASARDFGLTSGLLRSCANVGMVFSFAAAIVAASHSIPRALAFAIFVGGANLSGARGVAFVGGIHTALYLAVALMLVAAGLSGTRILSRKLFTGQADPPKAAASALSQVD
ncbi:MAG TPA: MFS transporter [Candidatus Dormibacteraeota bacterium]|nr:MFS transporter [Candidatus Dormibacteraeota bacterium]